MATKKKSRKATAPKKKPPPPQSAEKKKPKASAAVGKQKASAPTKKKATKPNKALGATDTRSDGQMLDYFDQLLETDRSRNLRERIDYFSAQDPEGFRRRLGFAEIVYKNHWVVIPIQGEGFAFSVGMNYEYRVPETMVLSNDLSDSEFQKIINQVNCHVRDHGPLELGRDYTRDILEVPDLDLATDPADERLPLEKRRLIASAGKRRMVVPIKKPLVFREYTEAIEARFPCGYLSTFNLMMASSFDKSVVVADLR